MNSISYRQDCPVKGVVNLPNFSNFPSRKELSHHAGKRESCQGLCAKQLLDPKLVVHMYIKESYTAYSSVITLTLGWVV